MKGLAWGIVYTLLTCALANAVGQQFPVPWKELLPWLSGFGDLLVGLAAVAALVAYPWQKRKDRELQMQAEMRLSAARYVSAVSNLKLSVFAKDGADQPLDLSLLRECSNRLAELSFYLSGDVMATVAAPHKYIARDEYKYDSPANQLREFRNRESAAILVLRQQIRAPRAISGAQEDAREVMIALDPSYVSAKDRNDRTKP